MKYVLPTATPESQGIPSAALMRFQQVLDESGVPLHSALFARNGYVVSQAYSAPFTENTLHRMFSVTKSFVSLAVGLLAAQGELSLDDRIVEYFPEYTAGQILHPYICQTTIRDMLRMATPHALSAYKRLYGPDWEQEDMVAAFFRCPPSHRPGSCFAYDTSATHVLCALVERLTGMELMSFLRLRCLDAIGFSQTAFCLKDAQGNSLGGSGLMATPYDLLLLMQLLLQNGNWEGRQLLPAEYIREATAKQIDNFAKPANGGLEESLGYGYQFWRVRQNGFACFGMGGQLAVCFPEKQLVFVTTADTQSIPGGVQLIYDAFFHQVWPALVDGPLPEAVDDQARLAAYNARRELPYVPGQNQSLLLTKINGIRYQLDKNPMGFRAVTLRLNGCQGALIYEKQNGTFTLHFSVGGNTLGWFPDRPAWAERMYCACSGAFRNACTFVVRAQLIGTRLGSVQFALTFDEKGVTLLLSKNEESLFAEYAGIVSGEKEA